MLSFQAPHYPTIGVEVLRGKGYPQTEDDPNPCTTQARISILSSDCTHILVAEECSSTQQNSNSPFYKDTLIFSPRNAEVSEGIIFIKIIEFSRKPEPLALFYGQQQFLASDFKTCKERSVTLTRSNPIEAADAARSELLAAENGDDSNTATMIIRIHVKIARPASIENVDADVEIEDGEAVLSGSTQLVPVDCEYVWLRLMLDAKWTETFRGRLIATWRDRAPLFTTNTAPKAAAKAPGGAGRRTTSVAAAPSQPEVRSIGDVITKRWSCKRIHQVLTRTRLCAEKHSWGTVYLTFTHAEEIEVRTEKKTRAKILEGISLASLEMTGNNSLRDWLERLWILFAIGIDHDPSAGKTLTYDTRKTVHDAAFDEDDAVILLASLLHFFVPSIPFDACQSIAEQEVRAALPEVGAAEAVTSPKWDVRLTAAQIRFTVTLISFVGPLMETLTEAELYKALRAFKPAIQDASTRIAKGGKASIKAKLRRADFTSSKKGDGLNIRHLDKLGRRKDLAKYVN